VNAFDLVRAGTDDPIAAACGKCGLVHSPKIYFAPPDRAMAAARQAADDCCTPRKCEDCGKETEGRGWLVCGRCRTERVQLQEQARFDAATVVPWDDAAGAMLWDEENDRWISDGDAPEDDEPPTRYAYATTPLALHINADNIIADALENGEHHDDAGDEIVPAERAELQSFLDGWCERTGVVSHFPDYSRVVVFEAAPTPATESHD
jgi:hypothetical protein